MNEEDTFGRFLRSLRARRGKGLRAASRGIGISPSYLSKLECDAVGPPSFKTMRRLAAYYQVFHEALVLRAKTRSYIPVEGLQRDDSQHKKAELLALYRAIRDLESSVLSELLRKAYEREGKTAEEVDQEIEATLREIKQEFPRLCKGKEGLLACEVEPRYLSARKIDKITEKILREHGITRDDYTPPTPIEDFVDVPGKFRLVLSDEWDGKHEHDDPAVLGMSRWSSQYPGEREIVISTRLFESPRSTMRARLNFTLAHELFHVLEHLPLMASVLPQAALARIGTLPPQIAPRVKKIRPSIRRIRLETWVKDDRGPRRLHTNEDWREWQANYFAACLLMPRKAIVKEFKERFEADCMVTPKGMNRRQYSLEVATTEISESYVFDASLSQLYQVSAQAMAIRLLQLGLVD